jgi:hypothetical protein
MNALDDSFELELSPAELFWLGGVLGETRLSLPGNPLRDKSAEEIQALMGKGQEVLQKRGLIRHRPGSGWEVERLLTLIIRWVAGTHTILSIDIHNHNGAFSQSAVYQLNKQSLMIRYSQEKYQCAIFQNQKALTGAVLDYFDFKGETRLGRKPLLIVEPWWLIPLAWQDASKCIPILRRNGYSLSDAKVVAEKLSGFNCVKVLSVLKTESEQPRAQARLILATDKHGYWIGQPSSTKSTQFLFTPAKSGEAVDSVNNFLKGIAH